MKLFAEIAAKYVRWRHSLGFGIHSPFAYDLVKSVVSPGKYAYYGYQDIDRELLMPDTVAYPQLRHDARLLLRLIVFLNAQSLLIYPPGQPVFDVVAKAAGIACRAASSPKGLPHPIPMPRGILIVRDKIPVDNCPGAFLDAGISVMAVDPVPQLRNDLLYGITRGLILEGKRIVIAIPRDEMVLTRYSMKF